MKFLTPELIEDVWYGKHPLSLFLLPLSWCYLLVTNVRRFCYQLGLIPSHRLPVPVVIVGNITVGGTGKTPLVSWLVNYLKEKGFKPGIISRGYGAKAEHWPQQVRPDSNAEWVGDEALLLARQTNVPVAISPKRYLAGEELINKKGCDILICDDGLQHLALERDLEILVIDGTRRFGNKRLLPAGPLREPVSRSKDFDLIVSNSSSGRHEHLMKFKGEALIKLGKESKKLSLNDVAGKRVHAIAGIGNPERFFNTLKAARLDIVKHVFPDHYHYTLDDVLFDDDLPVIMTEKDAVKCEEFVLTQHWYLPIVAEMGEAFTHRFDQLLGEVTHA